MTVDSCLVPRTDEPLAFLVSPRNLGQFPDRMELGMLVLEARENRRSRPEQSLTAETEEPSAKLERGLDNPSHFNLARGKYVQRCAIPAYISAQYDGIFKFRKPNRKQYIVR